MIPVKTSDTPHSYKAPEGQEDNVSDLPCHLYADDDGYQRAVVSYWRPDEQELEALANGHPIRMTVHTSLPFAPAALDVVEGVEIVEP